MRRYKILNYQFAESKVRELIREGYDEKTAREIIEEIDNHRFIKFNEKVEELKKRI